MTTVPATRELARPDGTVSRAPYACAEVPGWFPVTFALPPERVPRRPSAGPGRLLVCHETPFAVHHHDIDELPTLLAEGDVVVVNVSGSRDADPDRQTIFATARDAGAVPWAGRALSAATVLRLVVGGVVVVPLTLHAGSPAAAGGATAERYRVAEPTARIVSTARAAGRQVVAVGTTVLRALESVATADGRVAAGEGTTSLVLSPGYRLRAVTALLTGLHPPETSHLAVVEAFVGFDAFAHSYAVALRDGYRFGEWGDRQLLFRRPAPPQQRTGKEAS
jgi:S-adenosylmethionine:tRNA-ribosyltransferase-isomerase (queuine synthetase)